MKKLLILFSLCLIFYSCNDNINQVKQENKIKLKITIVDFNDDAIIYYAEKCEYKAFQSTNYFLMIVKENNEYLNIPMNEIKKITFENL
jgi:hypothetical protein